MKNVLVTGGSGSFGNAFVERAIKDKVERIVIYSRGEQLQEAMAQRFHNHPSLRFFIGDIRDRERLQMAMRGVDTVIHAAAMKIVPACEYNPFEAVMTNIHGAENVCRAAMSTGVTKVIALSTDKAANPVNLYGATKLAAEKIFVAANNLSAGSPAFSVVRYGNVVGSRGSVLPLFRRLVSERAPLPITDERMTRFWITLDQAVEFVLSSLEMMHGREIFIPKIPSIKITDLAKALDPVDIKVVGIRPGEKLHEVLMTYEEGISAMEAWDRFIVNSGPSNIKNPIPYTSDTNNQWLDENDLRRTL